MSEFWHKLGCCVVEKPQPEAVSDVTPAFLQAEEEEETDRPDHDWGTDEFCPPDSHWLWGDGGRRWTCHDRRGAGADAIQGQPGQAVEQFSGLVAPSGMVLLSEASPRSSPEEMPPPPGPSQNQCPGPPFCLVCLTVPQKARGLDSLCALWLQPLLVMGSRQQD